MPSRGLLPRAGALAAVLFAVAPTTGRSAAPDSARGRGVLGGASAWGTAYYQAVAADASPGHLGRWSVAQESGLVLNLRSDQGLDFLGNFVFRTDAESDASQRAVLQQLSLRVAPAPGVTIIAGRQRVNWGTAKVFPAIDTVEVRANPLDVRSFPTGVSGVKAVIIPNEWLSCTFVALPATEMLQSRGGARIDFTAKDIELDLGLGVIGYTFFDRPVAPGAEPGRQTRTAFLSDGAWSSGRLVIYEEMELRRGRETAYRFPAMSGFQDFGGRDRPVFRAVAGLTFQADLGLTRPATLLTEYLYNGDGMRSEEARSFAADHADWQRSGSAPGEEVPAAITGIGGFRRQYLATAVQNVAVGRYLVVGAMGILGLDSGFSRLSASLEWDPTQSSSVKVSYEYFTALRGSSAPPTELLLIPFRNRATIAFSTSY